MTTNWVSKFAESGLSVLSKSLPNKRKISEITILQGSFSSPFLKMLPSDITLYRTDYPTQDYNTLSKTSLPFPTYFVPGSIFHQLYPNDSIDLIYAFQVFNQLSRPIYATDHLLSTLTTNSLLTKILSSRQDVDLAFLLEIRHKELSLNGELVFDTLIKPQVSDQPYSWDCLDLAVQLAAQLFNDEQRKKLNLHVLFRTKSQLMSTINSLSTKFEVLESNEELVEMPAYTEFLSTGNIEKYCEDLIEFWKYPITVMVVRAFKNTLKQNEVNEIVMKIMGYFKEICSDMKPRTSQSIIFTRLGKRN